MRGKSQLLVDQPGSHEPVVISSYSSPNGSRAGELTQALAHALDSDRARQDGVMLTASICNQAFCNEALHDTSPFGVGTELHTDSWRVIRVYPDSEMVAFESETPDDDRAGETYGFNEFIHSETDASPTTEVADLPGGNRQ